MDAVQQLLNPGTRKKAALQLGYQGVVKLLSHPEPVRSAAIEALGYFPEGHERLVELLGKEPTHHAPVAGLVIAKYPPSKLLTHPNELVRLRAARYLIRDLDYRQPKDREEIKRVLKAVAKGNDSETAKWVFSAFAGRLAGNIPPDVLDALAEAAEAWGHALADELKFYVHVFAACAQYPQLRGRAMNALERLAKFKNSLGNLAEIKLHELRGGKRV